MAKLNKKQVDEIKAETTPEKELEIHEKIINESKSDLVSGDTANESWQKPEEKSLSSETMQHSEEYLASLKAKGIEMISAVSYEDLTHKVNTANKNLQKPYNNNPLAEVAAENPKLEEPTFNDQKSDVATEAAPRYHKQDIVNIAHVIHEANKALALTNGDASLKHWDDESDEIKGFLINGVEKTLTSNFISIDNSSKREMLCIAIVNALK